MKSLWWPDLPGWWSPFPTIMVEIMVINLVSNICLFQKEQHKTDTNHRFLYGNLLDDLLVGLCPDGLHGGLPSEILHGYLPDQLLLDGR